MLLIFIFNCQKSFTKTENWIVLNGIYFATFREKNHWIVKWLSSYFIHWPNDRDLYCSTIQERTTCFTFNFKSFIEPKEKNKEKWSAIVPFVPYSFRHLQVVHSILSDASGSKSSCSKNRCNQMSFDLIRSISLGWNPPVIKMRIEKKRKNKKIIILFGFGTV